MGDSNMMRFKLYNLKSEYIEQLNTINEEKGFPNKGYSKIINGVRKYFVSDKIMTRTWAREDPRETKEKKFPLPIPGENEKDFTIEELVKFDKNWYPEEDFGY